MARREEVVIATKACRTMGPGTNRQSQSRKNFIYSIGASLKRESGPAQ